MCVGVLTGTSERGDLESIADIVLDDITSLPGYLNSLLRTDSLAACSS